MNEKLRSLMRSLIEVESWDKLPVPLGFSIKEIE
jgi:lysophospholipid acyltransferase (LPLAT)-like uncharacterized protein